MIVLQHRPLVQTILDEWRASLRKDTPTGILIVKDEDFRRLVRELILALDEMVAKDELCTSSSPGDETGVATQ